MNMRTITLVGMLCALGTLGACSSKSDTPEAAAASGGENIQQTAKHAGDKAEKAGNQAKAAGEDAKEAADKAGQTADEIRGK